MVSYVQILDHLVNKSGPFISLAAGLNEWFPGSLNGVNEEVRCEVFLLATDQHLHLALCDCA